MGPFYKEINIWERHSDSEAVCYRCFEILPEGKYCVQSSDFFRKATSPKHLTQLERQFIELLIEEAPEKRSPVFPTLQEAIERHKLDFEPLSYDKSLKAL